MQKQVNIKELNKLNNLEGLKEYAKMTRRNAKKALILACIAAVFAFSSLALAISNYILYG